MNKRIPQLASILVILIACLVLIGWQFDILLLKSGFPNSVATMKVNTALVFLLAGISLWLLHSQNLNYRIVQKIAGAIVVVIGVLTLSEYLFNWNLGIDQLLFLDTNPSEVTLYPGRMGANTAVNFIFMGIALLWLRGNRQRDILVVQLFSSIAAFIALLALFGHLFSESIFYTLTLSSRVQAPPFTAKE